MNKPQPQILFIWRILLSVLCFAAVFIMSVLLKTGSTAWAVAVSCAILLFLLCYLIYLPLLYGRMTYTIKDEKIIFTTGVFLSRKIMMPLSAIQFVTVSQNIFAKLFGLSSVIITAAGGRMVIPGLKTVDANALAKALREE